MTLFVMVVLPLRKVILMNCVLQARVNMPSADLLIFLRERLLDIVSGSDRGQALNLTAVPNVDPMDGDSAAELSGLLHEVLSSGLTEHGENVDYASLRATSLYDDFRPCTGKLHAFDPSTLPDRNAQLAFWINLYNILVLDAVIVLGVRRGITEQRTGLTFLRANRGHPLFPGEQFNNSDPRLRWVIEPFDARIHFALNCASRSCPPIRAYTPEKLEAQLDLATRSYLATEVQIPPGKNALHLSSILKWFATDFGGRDGIIDFVLSYLHCAAVKPPKGKRQNLTKDDMTQQAHPLGLLNYEDHLEHA